MIQNRICVSGWRGIRKKNGQIVPHVKMIMKVKTHQNKKKNKKSGNLLIVVVLCRFFQIEWIIVVFWVFFFFSFLLLVCGVLLLVILHTITLTRLKLTIFEYGNIKKRKDN